MFNLNTAFLLVQKLKSNSGDFKPGVNAEIEKQLFNLPQVTIKCWRLWPCIGPKAEKRIPSNMEGQSATLGANVPAFISGAKFQWCDVFY